MKRAMINIHISAHELKGNELREVIPSNVMKENGVPINTLVSFDGENEFEVLKKVREWLALANPAKGPA